MPFTLFRKNSPSVITNITEGEYRVVPKGCILWAYHIMTTIRYDYDITIKVIGPIPNKPNLIKGIIMVSKYSGDKEILVELRNGEIATEIKNTFVNEIQ